MFVVWVFLVFGCRTAAGDRGFERLTGAFGGCSPRAKLGFHRIDPGLSSLCVRLDTSREGGDVLFEFSTEGPCELDAVYLAFDKDRREVTSTPRRILLPVSLYDRARMVSVRAVDKCGHSNAMYMTESGYP